MQLLNERHRKIQTMLIEYSKGKLQYKSEQLVTHVQIPAAPRVLQTGKLKQIWQQREKGGEVGGGRRLGTGNTIHREFSFIAFLVDEGRGSRASSPWSGRRLRSSCCCHCTSPCFRGQRSTTQYRMKFDLSVFHVSFCQSTFPEPQSHVNYFII